MIWEQELDLDELEHVVGGAGSGPLGRNDPALPIAGPSIYLSGQVYNPATGAGVSWSTDHGMQPLLTHEAGIFSIDTNGKTATTSMDVPTGIPGITVGPRFDTEGSVDLGAKAGFPGANVEIGAHLANPFTLALQDARVDTLRADFARNDPAAFVETQHALGITDATARALVGMPALDPSHGPVFENPTGSPGAQMADLSRANMDSGVAMQGAALDYMTANHLSPTDVSHAAMDGAPVTMPGGTNGIVEWGPTQITGVNHDPLHPGDTFQLTPAPLAATTGELMSSLGYTPQQIADINAHNNAPAPDAPVTTAPPMDSQFQNPTMADYSNSVVTTSGGGDTGGGDGGGGGGGGMSGGE